MESNKNYNYFEINKIINKLDKIESIIFKLFLTLFLFLDINFFLKKKIYLNKETIINNIDFLRNSSLTNFNKYYLFEYLNNSEYLSITSLDYSFSFKYKIIKVEYHIGFYDKNNNLILPSDITLYKNLHIFCNIVIKDTINIDSLANIYKNTFYNCIEFCEIKEKIEFGLKINQNLNYSKIYFFNEKIFNYNNLIYKYNDIFDPLFVIDKYNSLIKNINNKNLHLKKSYIEYPYCITKRDFVIYNTNWNFKNIYNHYFCFCKGRNCLENHITESCKYYFYLYIIDLNKNIYQKTDYLFIDFIFAKLSSDDTYPIFQEMVKQNFPVHYITENNEIYNKYCINIKNCKIILPVKNEKNPINSNFLEKYLTLLLKIKVVVSGRGTTFNTNLFYNIEYITYLCVGHGVCYFKYYLYNHDRIYGINKNNKLLLPPSEKIISIAKKYGWKDENIIKLNLPRWDKYNSNEINEKKTYIYSNSIFIMFTWRKINKNKLISSFYLNNIINLINNDILNEMLIKKNTTLYISFHRLVETKYINIIKNKIIYHKYIRYIEQGEISECLSKTSLVVSDFSSIIFDLIYRRKPFIIYIPDGNDPQIKEIYNNEYYELILLMKNGSIYFENKYFDINQTVNKINYYINNNFNLDIKLKKFYDSFGFKKENNLNKFIYYLKNIV